MNNLPKLESLKSVHIIGVCGTLMGAFAAFLKRYGIDVTGSDQNVYPPMSDVLTQAGVTLLNGYKPENLSAAVKRPDLVVIGNVISATNPEARAAIDGGYAYCSLPEAMENLMLKTTRNLVVSGTHGKTTTSCMLAHVLVCAKRDPNYFIGGVSKDLPYSFHVASLGQGHPFVLEGDEYDTAFWDKVPKFNHYLPDDVILTSVEYDHADIYPNFEAVVKAFEGLMARIRAGGRLIACVDYAEVAKMAENVAKNGNATVLTYGLGTGQVKPRFSIGNAHISGAETHFEIIENGKVVDEAVLQVPGNHNLLNALSVWIECRELGIHPDQIRTALRGFRGVKRRQEVSGEIRGVTVIDDFAHHPTAVRETLKALRTKYPGRRLLAVFEPRSATSRRKIFQNDYVNAFGEADAVFVAKPYDQSRIAAEDQFSSDQLISDISTRGMTGFLMESVESGIQQVARFARNGDVVAVLSNGGFGGFIPKLLKALGN